MITIGSGPRNSPTTAVDLLLDCHGRIRSFTAMAGRLAHAREASAEEIRDAARRIQRYFSEALPLHVQDEEETVLPRLRSRDPALDAALARMHAEHQSHQRDLEALTELCTQLVDAPHEHSETRLQLAEVAGALARAFSPHLEQEEQLIFPAIERLLGPEEQAHMLTEIRARRRAALAATR